MRVLHVVCSGPLTHFLHLLHFLAHSSITILTVSPDSLLCEDDDEEEDDSSVICATNGVTYPSLCRMIQDTGNEAMAHTGPCDREECDGGLVS